MLPGKISTSRSIEAIEEKHLSVSSDELVGGQNIQIFYVSYAHTWLSEALVRREGLISHVGASYFIMKLHLFFFG